MRNYLNRIVITGERTYLKNFDNSFKKQYTKYDQCYNDEETLQEIVETLQKDGYKNIQLIDKELENNIVCISYEDSGYNLENIIPSNTQDAFNYKDSVWPSIEEVTKELWLTSSNSKLKYTFYSDKPLPNKLIEKMASMLPTSDVGYMVLPENQTDLINRTHLEIKYLNTNLFKIVEYTTIHSRRTFEKRLFKNKYIDSNCSICNCPLNITDSMLETEYGMIFKCPCCETQLKYTLKDKALQFVEHNINTTLTHNNQLCII